MATFRPRVSARIPLPQGWRFVAPRPDLAPAHGIDAGPGGRRAAVLRISATGDPLAFGWWVRRLTLKPGGWYRARVAFRTTDDVDPSLCVLVNLFWGEYPTRLKREEFFSHFSDAGDGWVFAEHLFQMPDGEKQVDLQLHLHSAAAGSVWFANPAIEPAQAPPDRPVTLATTWFRRVDGSSRAGMLKRIASRLDEAGHAHADVVLIPECVTGHGVAGKDHRAQIEQDAEPLGGPATRLYQDRARRHRMYVLGWIHERDGKRIFNTTLVIDRKGRIVGTYRKCHLHWPELWCGISPGHALPVFDTDFARIGIYTCYENWLPLVAQNLAMKGAEILFLPTAGYLVDVFRTRCLDNNCYGVVAGLNSPSCIVASDGTLMAELRNDGLITARANLAVRPTHAYAYRHPNLTYGLPGADRLLDHSLSRMALDEISALTHGPIVGGPAPRPYVRDPGDER